MVVKQIDIDSLDFAKSGGLIPAVIQDHKTSRVLMLGYMNESSLKKTIVDGKVCFFSRSKNRLWTKGETSGNFLELISIGKDCDSDSLLLLVDAKGPTCHLGSVSCFESLSPDLTFLGELEKVIQQKIVSKDEKSYTFQLSKDPLKAAQKVGEEGVEVALAAAAQSEGQLIDEAADLIYHLTVCLNSKSLSIADVMKKLKERHHSD